MGVKGLLSVWMQLPVAAPKQPSWAARAARSGLSADADWQQAHEVSLATPLLAFFEKMKTPLQANRYILSKSL